MMRETATVRTQKVASLLQQELALVLRREINDPRISSIGMITVSKVELANDHRNATVYLSFMGEKSGEKERKEAINIFNKAAGFLRSTLLKRLSLRTIPQLYFRYDSSFEYAARIQTLMQNI